ncbi:MAG: ATP-binding protein [Fimbriimonas sp.]|nr:ATP-binding protein [Fimbriimonas sp.]
MIRTRLAAWNMAVLTAVLITVGGIAFVSTRASLYGAVDAELNRRGDFLLANFRNLPDKPPKGARLPDQGMPGVDPAQFRRIEFEYYITRPRFQFSWDRATPADNLPWSAAAAARSLGGSRELLDSRIEGRRVRVLSLPLVQRGKIVGSAQLAASLENADAGAATLGRVLILMLPVALVLTGACGVWLTRRALRPVADFAEAAGRIEATNLSDRMPSAGRDEFAHLGSVFNSMLDRLEGSFRDLEEANAVQRRFVADASHELKTPLTAIRMRLDIAAQKVQTPEKYAEHLASLSRSTDRMSAIVSDLLLLARADDGRLVTAKRTVPLESLAEEAVSIVEDARGRHIEVEIERGLTLIADEAGLSRAITNLLDNACRHTPDHGTVALKARREASRVLIQVVDTGTGIATRDLPHIFDRFYRAGSARERDTGGTGLGLAVVQSIVTAHQGLVSIESEVGHGTTVTIDLPGNH